MDDAAAAELRNRARALWGLGDYEPIAERLMPVAEQLVTVAGVTRGDAVLDVAAGTGNVAVAAAAAGATVTACDLAPAMIELGRRRTAAAGIEVDWREGDAEALPFADGSFDHALSAFGMIMAPRPERAAHELLRVVRPGGTAALTAWVPEGPQAAAGELLARQFPPSPAPGPDLWGDPARARERLESAGAADVRVERRVLRWEFASAAAWVSFMEAAAPPVVAAREAVGEERWAVLREELLAVVEAHGATGAGGAFVVAPPYLLVAARRPPG